jgi:excinuclease UvrABC helicase subunit UvrB
MRLYINIVGRDTSQTGKVHSFSEELEEMERISKQAENERFQKEEEELFTEEEFDKADLEKLDKEMEKTKNEFEEKLKKLIELDKEKSENRLDYYESLLKNVKQISFGDGK